MALAIAVWLNSAKRSGKVGQPGGATFLRGSRLVRRQRTEQLAVLLLLCVSTFNLNQSLAFGILESQNEIAVAYFNKYSHKLTCSKHESVGVNFAAGNPAFDLRAWRQRTAILLRVYSRE